MLQEWLFINCEDAFEWNEIDLTRFVTESFYSSVLQWKYSGPSWLVGAGRVDRTWSGSLLEFQHSGWPDNSWVTVSVPVNSSGSIPDPVGWSEPDGWTTPDPVLYWSFNTLDGLVLMEGTEQKHYDALTDGKVRVCQNVDEIKSNISLRYANTESNLMKRKGLKKKFGFHVPFRSV